MRPFSCDRNEKLEFRKNIIVVIPPRQVKLKIQKWLDLSAPIKRNLRVKKRLNHCEYSQKSKSQNSEIIEALNSLSPPKKRKTWNPERIDQCDYFRTAKLEIQNWLDFYDHILLSKILKFLHSMLFQEGASSSSSWTKLLELSIYRHWWSKATSHHAAATTSSAAATATDGSIWYILIWKQ